MFFKKYKELILGCVMTAFAIFYCVMSTQIKQKPDVIGAATVPYILAAIMGLLGVLQLCAGVKAMRGFSAEKAAQEKPADSDSATLLKTIVLIVAYLLLLRPLGFIISTFLYLFFQFITLTPVERKPKLWLYALIAVLVSVVVYLGFRYGLQLILPQGLIKVV